MPRTVLLRLCALRSSILHALLSDIQHTTLRQVSTVMQDILPQLVCN